jgi:hypothetical protein
MPAKYYIKILSDAAGLPCEYAGCYLQNFWPELDDGAAHVQVTPDVKHAKLFDSAGDAAEFWKTQSKVVPLRPDGLPNRPLTAFTVEISSI